MKIRISSFYEDTDNNKVTIQNNNNNNNNNNNINIYATLTYTHGSPNLGQKTKHNNKQKKRTCKIVDFAVPADHRIKLKESEKKDKYLDLARELKNYGT